MKQNHFHWTFTVATSGKNSHHPLIEDCVNEKDYNNSTPKKLSTKGWDFCINDVLLIIVVVLLIQMILRRIYSTFDPFSEINLKGFLWNWLSDYRNASKERKIQFELIPFLSSIGFIGPDGINFGMTMSKWPVRVDRCDDEPVILISSLKASWKILPLTVTRI